MLSVVTVCYLVVWWRMEGWVMSCGFDGDSLSDDCCLATKLGMSTAQVVVAMVVGGWVCRQVVCVVVESL